MALGTAAAVALLSCGMGVALLGLYRRWQRKQRQAAIRAVSAAAASSTSSNTPLDEASVTSVGQLVGTASCAAYETALVAPEVTRALSPEAPPLSAEVSASQCHDAVAPSPSSASRHAEHDAESLLPRAAESPDSSCCHEEAAATKGESKGDDDDDDDDDDDEEEEEEEEDASEPLEDMDEELEEEEDEAWREVPVMQQQLEWLEVQLQV